MKRIGILGAGGMGGTHARHYASLGKAEIGVFDVDAEKRNGLAERHGLATFDTEEALLAWADAVDICTPTPLHAAQAERAIASGKGILIEKPLAGTLDEARRIVESANRSGTPLMVGQVVRFFPEFARANKLVKDGKVGRPAAIRMRRGGGPPRSEWFLDHTKSGGILVDLAVHDFDWLRWTFGEVAFLYARSVGAKTNRGPDYALTTLTFESGAVAHVESTWMDPAGGRVTLEVCGSEGMIQFDSRTTASLRTHAGPAPRLESPLSPEDDPYRNQLAAFVRYLEGAEPPVTGEDGFMALSIGLAARESALSGRVVVPEKL